jgi:Ca2+-binding EF-hand superfamily protein
MKINGNFNSNPMLFAQSPKTAAAHANAAAMQQAMEQAGGPAGGSPGAPITMRSGSGQPPVDVNTILENWGTSNAIADLNVDGIVDAQDLAMVLQAAQDSGNGGSNNSDSEAWNTLVGGDLNGDGVVDAVDLAMKLNAESNGGGDGDGSNNDSSGDGNDAWTTLVGGDLNGDGVVDAVDLAMKLNAESNGGDGSNNDSNDDGNDAWTTLVGGDLNGDGVVDAVDLAMKLNAESNGGDGSNNDSSDGDGAWNPLGGGSISPVDASKLLEELELDAGSEQMVERLTNLIMKSFDSDGDGVISADNLPQNSKLVSYFDRDSSGLLERNELMKGLAEEFRRATEASDGANPAAFARRWMETFNGVQSIPSYNSPARLQELFLGRVDGQVSLSNQSILSAQA